MRASLFRTFHMVALIFILFDIEAIFLYPWALIYHDFKVFWLCGDVALHYDFACRLYFPLEKGRAGLGQLTAHPESDK